MQDHQNRSTYACNTVSILVYIFRLYPLPGKTPHPVHTIQCRLNHKLTSLTTWQENAIVFGGVFVHMTIISKLSFDETGNPICKAQTNKHMVCVECDLLTSRCQRGRSKAKHGVAPFRTSVVYVMHSVIGSQGSYVQCTNQAPLYFPFSSLYYM